MISIDLRTLFSDDAVIKKGDLRHHCCQPQKALNAYALNAAPHHAHIFFFSLLSFFLSFFLSLIAP